MESVVIGVLALQGAFVEHVSIYGGLHVKTKLVRLPEHLDDIDGLLLPGGESTAISLLARRWGLIEPIRAWINSGKPIWGTCAGMILLANKLTGKMKEGQEIFGGLDATVYRNYFGSQLGSFSAELESTLEGHDHTKYKAVFIRAPAIVQHGPSLEILATVRPKRTSKEAESEAELHDAIVAARQNNILVTSFHPELTHDTCWHEYFLHMVFAATTSQ